MRIDGKTELVGIIGYPLGHTLSPVMHNAAFRALGMNWAYVPLRVEPGGLKAALGGLRCLGFKGANVTIPHKVEAASCLDELRGDAEVLRAVNTIVVEGAGMIGYNTDAEGFLRFLVDEGVQVEGTASLVIGAGGAARAVALALARAGCRAIHVMNRTAAKAEEMRELLKRATSVSEISLRTFDSEGAKVLGECDIVVNTTPLAASDAGELPLDYDDFAEGKTAVDLKYAGDESAFLARARSRGAATADGAGMLLRQAAASFRLWTGREPPLREMRSAFDEERDRNAIAEGR